LGGTCYPVAAKTVKNRGALYEKGRERDEEVFKEDIRLSNSELQTVVGYLAGTDLGNTDLDSKGRAFETFMTGFFRGEFGQYFTPRNIVKFIVDALPITHDSVVIDTSCGSGGFLLHALDKVRREADKMADDGYFSKKSVQHHRHWHDFAENNLFGIEISEGIARTAKMNNIDPQAWMADVLACLPSMTVSRVHELLPWNWKAEVEAVKAA
jgi:type I restriction enzyme M protein